MIQINLTKEEIIDLLDIAIHGLKEDDNNCEYEITGKIIKKQLNRYEDETRRLKGNNKNVKKN